MGKTEKTQSKLQFRLLENPRPHNENVTVPETGQDAAELEVGCELRQILTAIQHSITKIDGKIDALTFCMDQVSECFDKHWKPLRPVAEDEQIATSASQKQMEKALASLQAKMEVLKARSR
ncbi:hypothetical protein NDU88_000011 [Pleurodeles waltl]|uniref:Uncharacterized protein n=1 Tax=Pleurodeles waltl TaxID=8319 RepID=A0AAV7VV93_PLEWA|nr:hypothetical protein NDU88_000011 [Pleurodeles waltl]